MKKINVFDILSIMFIGLSISSVYNTPEMSELTSNDGLAVVIKYFYYGIMFGVFSTGSILYDKLTKLEEKLK